MTPLRRTVVLFIVALVGLYYYWGVRATTDGFAWHRQLNGYYNYLGRAFASGQIHLPVEPSPDLLRQPDPRDPAVDVSLKMHDLVLFKGRYYLYHGAAPALLLFAPWYRITGQDLPENFALFLLCTTGYLASCAALLRLLHVASAWPGPFLLALMLLALGLCQSVPFLLNRIWVYEIAIAGGYFFLSVAILFLTLGLTTSEPRRARHSLAAAGLAFGAAVASRPHLILCAAIAALTLAIFLGPKRRLTAFLLPLIAAGIAIGAYNYLRFGNPAEFGLQYLLTGPHQNQLDLHPRNWSPGTYFMLLAPPYFSSTFPWARMILRYPFDSHSNPFPPHYFIEPVVGSLWLAPFAVCALLIVPATRILPAVRTILVITGGSSFTVFLFLITTHMATQRYQVDFLPLAVFAALVAAAVLIARSVGPRRTALTASFATLLIAGIITSLALAFTGPYDELRKAQPARYTRIAGWFSPASLFRPLLKPEIALDLTATIFPQPNGSREPLVAIGDGQYLLYVEHSLEQLRLVSQSESVILNRLLNNHQVRITITYAPQTAELVTTIDRSESFRHTIPALITAPAQVKLGQNDVEFSVARRFKGQIQLHRKLVFPSPP